MAKAFFNQIAKAKGLRYRAESAGTVPGDRVHANVVTAMREIGIDLATAEPSLLTDEMVSAASRVITLGCAVDAEACPAVFLKNVVDWGLPDPKDKPLEEVRAIRDDVRTRVEHLLDALVCEDTSLNES